LTEKISGQLETLVLDNGQHVLGIPAHWRVPNEPLKFDVIIEKNQLVLSTSCLGEPDKTNNPISRETDASN